MDLDPKYDCGTIEKKCDSFNEKGKPTLSTHATIHYETIDGRHVPKTIGWETRYAGGEATRRSITVESCSFGPPPAKVFELTSYGDFPMPKASPEPSAHVGIFARIAALHIGILAWIAGGLTLLTLLLASCLTLKSVRCR